MYRICPGRFVSALGVQPGMRVLDCCAAPGGKSFTLAQRMENEGELVAGDLYPKKSCPDWQRGQTAGPFLHPCDCGGRRRLFACVGFV